MRRLSPLILALLLAGCQMPVFNDGSTAGEIAPDFTVNRIGGTPAKGRLSDHKGKVVLLDFWATWCGPCHKASAEVEKLYAKYHDKGLEVMAISEEEAETVTDFQKKEQLTYPLYVDPFKSSVAPFKVESYPTFILIDRNGRVLGDLRGYADGMLSQMVEPAMK